MTSDTQAALVLRIAEQHGVVRSREITAAGIPRSTLMRLVRAGRLKQAGRGLYVLPEQRLSRQHVLAEVATRSSRGVFCLLTALRFHKIAVPSSNTIWLAIPNKSRAPRIDNPPLRIVRFSGAALTEGIEQHVVDGVTIRVYSLDKTLADCFKFRSKVGLDVAIDALRTSRRLGLLRMQDLWHYARICRVTAIMRPYLNR